MKNSSRKSDSPANFSHIIMGGLGKEVKQEFYSKEVNPFMTQLTIPSASVWDKIVAELDEQDRRRNDADIIISSSFKNKKKVTKSYFVTFACISLVAGIIWIVS